MEKQKKIAVVTGASSGIGREFVRQIGGFYKGLDEIWVIARRKERLEELERNCAVPVRIFQGDLLGKQIYKEYHSCLKEERPNVRMLVNSAGFGKSGIFLKIASDTKRLQTEMIHVNCSALTLMTQITIPWMKPGGRIVNLASAAAFCPQYGFAVYAASKAYVLNFSRALASELKRNGVYVTAVCPGPVNTEFFEISGELTSTFKKLALAEPDKVVCKALKDCRKKRTVSVYGLKMNLARAGAKFLPHNMILKLEEILIR